MKTVTPGTRRQAQLPDTVFLVWVREGKYGDSEPKVVRASLPGAQAWCNENRKLQGADPIQWSDYADGVGGEARCSRGPVGEFHYYIESLPFGE